MQEPEIEVRPCGKCGARDRYKNGKCRPCTLEENRRYREANPDKVLETQRRYREANRDKVLERKRSHYEANRDKVLERKRSHYEANRDKVREYQRSYREANRDKVLERERRYYEANRDKIQEQSRRRREVNPDKVRERERRWYEANLDKVREQKGRYREANLDKVRKNQRRYRELNPDVSLRAKHNRRARKNNPNYPDDKLSRGLKKKLMKLQGGKCAYANAPLADWCAVDITKQSEMDHIMPFKLKGRNIDSNMQLTCRACNRRKSDSHPDDFARRVGLIV